MGIDAKSAKGKLRSPSGQTIPYVIIAILIVIIVIGLLLYQADRGGEGTVEIELIDPSGEIERSSNLTIVFDKPVAKDSLINVLIENDLIRFDPDIPGRVQWISENQLRFYPDRLFLPSSEYRITLDRSRISHLGYSLKGNNRFSFHTSRLSIIGSHFTFDYDTEGGATASLTATIEFSCEVDPVSARDNIRLENANGNSIDFQVVTQQRSAVINIIARGVERGENDSEIRLIVKKDIRCAGGNLGLASKYETSAALAGRGRLVVESLEALYTRPGEPFLRLTFNIPIKVEGIGGYFSIDPEIDFHAEPHYRYVDLKADFESGETYKVTVAEALRAVDGSTLDRPFRSAITVVEKEVPPQIDFVGDGFYLARKGNMHVGLSTINIDSVAVEIDQVFSNNLTYMLNNEDPGIDRPYYYSQVNLPSVGRNIDEFVVQVDRQFNKEVVTPLDVSHLFESGYRGMFRITARQFEHRWRSQARWILATDIGLLAKKTGNDLWVWANSLNSVEPLSGVRVTLVSRNNQKLGVRTTGRDGLLIFRNIEQYYGERDPHLLIAERDDDFSFLELERRVIPTSDFDVGGIEITGDGYRSHIYYERDIYRPGETVSLAAIVRGASLASPEPLPLMIAVRDPRSVVLSEQRKILNSQGMVEFETQIPDYALTGRYNVKVSIGNEIQIGSSDFLVEEFLPDRMKVKLTTDAKEYSAGDSLRARVEALTLFGPPASGRNASAVIDIEDYPFTPEAFAGFTFFDSRKQFKSQRFKLGDTVLDEDGLGSFEFKIPGGLDPPASLRGIVSCTVLEPGGRAVTEYEGVRIHPQSGYVGLRKTEEGYAEPNKPSQFEAVFLDTDGIPVSEREISLKIFRVYWQTILRQTRGGEYRYESERIEDEVKSMSLQSQAEPVAFNFVPTDNGKYRIVARETESGASSAIEFYASGWGYSPWAMESPDRIEIDFDKEEYRSGETARVQLRAPFPGQALLTIERDTIYEQRVLEMSENTATVDVPVNAGYKPNVYVSVHLIRSIEGIDKDTPVRAFGAAPLHVSAADHKLEVSLDLPDVIRPKTTLPIGFNVSNAGGKSVHLTVAAVDEGILQLTDFENPDPFEYFFAKRRLSVETMDLYGMILPEIEPSQSSPGGDVEAARKRHLTPGAVRRVKPVSYWSGIVQTDERGFGSVKYDVPQFNGKLRIMAVAVQDNRFGGADGEVIVRDPIVLTPTFPRFIAPTDSFTVPISVFNGTGKSAIVDLRLTADGPVRLIDSNFAIDLADEEERAAYFRVEAENALGKASFKIRATAPGVSTEYSVDIPVRAPVPYETYYGSGSIQEGETVSFMYPSNIIPGTDTHHLMISSLPTVRFAKSLQYLLRYPHGCLEQTVSRAFPLLYFDEIAKAAEPDLFETNSADYYVEEAIRKVENLQSNSGDFSFWPATDYQNDWATVYATHFLIEARKRNFTVSDRVYKRATGAVERLSNAARNVDGRSLTVNVYACYALALAGEPNRSRMHYLKDNLLDKLVLYSRYQLAGAFALSGDEPTARELLPKRANVAFTDEERESGGVFNSPTRARAIALEVLLRIDARSPIIPGLISELTRSATDLGRWYSTQDNAFALMALGKALETQEETDFQGTVVIGGEAHAFDETGLSLTSDHYMGDSVTITIDGSGTAYYYWRTDGLPSDLNIREYDNDIVVRRVYRDENGNAITGGRFEQGDLVIVDVYLKAPNEPLSNVAVVEVLPSGFEIENPRLRSSQQMKWIGRNTYKPQYTDIRDDRLILYGELAQGKDEHFYYAVRAVTAGEFILPPIRAEAMYAPMKASVASSGQITIVQPKRGD